MATDKCTRSVRSIRPPVDLETVRRRAGRARDRLYEAQAISNVAMFAAVAGCEDSETGVNPAEIRRVHLVANSILNETNDALDEAVIAEPTTHEELDLRVDLELQVGQTTN